MILASHTHTHTQALNIHWSGGAVGLGQLWAAVNADSDSHWHISHAKSCHRRTHTVSAKYCRGVYSPVASSTPDGCRLSNTSACFPLFLLPVFPLYHLFFIFVTSFSLLSHCRRFSVFHIAAFLDSVSSCSFRLISFSVVSLIITSYLSHLCLNSLFHDFLPFCIYFSSPSVTS